MHILFRAFWVWTGVLKWTGIWNGMVWNGMGTLIFGGSDSDGTERNWDRTDTDIRGSDSWDRFLLFQPFIFSLAVVWEWIRPDLGFGSALALAFRKRAESSQRRRVSERKSVCMFGVTPVGSRSGGRAELSSEVVYRRLLGCVGSVF